MKIETLIDFYEEIKKKGEICLGFDYNVNLTGNSDETRQLIAFMTKELNDYLYISNVDYFDINAKEYNMLKFYPQLIKILEALNFI